MPLKLQQDGPRDMVQQPKNQINIIPAIVCYFGKEDMKIQVYERTEILVNPSDTLKIIKISHFVTKSVILTLIILYPLPLSGHNTA